MSLRQRGGKGRKVSDSQKETKNKVTKETSPDYDDLVAILKPRDSLSDGIFPIVTTILMGLVFGFALNKGRVAEPIVIMDQFKFTRWTMMKMFLSAAGTSSIVLSISAFIFPNYFRFCRTKHVSSNNLPSTIIGGLILGAGMAIGGACPGMVLIQVGAGVPNSLITLLGALTGAFIYGLTEPFFRSLFASNDLKDFVFLDQGLSINYSILSFIFGSLLIGFSMCLDGIFPWESELIKSNINECNILECRNWSPIISGILVGLLQIPCLLILGNTLGGASSYACVMGQWLRCMPNNVCNYFKHFKGSLNRFWQLLYVTSAILGSMLAVIVGGGNVYNLINEPFDDIIGTTRNKAFIGGFLMLFGARLAKGCTSGHGLSGMAVLATASMIAVAAMFVGGGIVAILLQVLDL